MNYTTQSEIIMKIIIKIITKIRSYVRWSYNIFVDY